MNYLQKYNLKRNEVVHHLFGIEDLEKLAIEYENDNMLNQSLFFYRLLYSINKENSIFEKIKKLDLMLRKQKKNLII